MAAPPDVAAMAARIAELEANNIQLNALGVQVQGQLRASQEQLVIARERDHAPRPKIPAPRTFGGETGVSVDEWIDDMSKQFVHYSQYFRTDTLKIDHALMYVHTKVTNWYQSSSVDRLAAGRVIRTWVEFVAALRERYQPVSSSMAARSKLDRMVQTGNVQSYAQYFYSNMTYITDMSSADQVHQFTRGLKPAIKFEVVKLKVRTLTDAVQAAIAAEAYMPNGSGAASSSSLSFQYRPHRGGGASSSMSAPMDVNSIAEYDHSSEYDNEYSDQLPSSSRESQLGALVSQLQAQLQVQQQVNAMFGGKDRNHKSGNNKGGASSSSTSSSFGTRVANVSREDYDRCRRERVCLNCKEPGHIAGGSTPCAKPYRLNW